MSTAVNRSGAAAELAAAKAKGLGGAWDGLKSQLETVALVIFEKVGPGLEAGMDMGPAVDEKQWQTDLRYIEVAKQEGAQLLTGGERTGFSALRPPGCIVTSINSVHRAVRWRYASTDPPGATALGRMALQRIPKRPSSFATVRVKPMTPSFAAA